MRFLFALILLLAPGFRAEALEITVDDVARFVSGKPVSVSSPLNRLTQLRPVRRHYDETGELSRQWKDARLDKVSQWSLAEIQPRLSRPNCVKYMFGGPDFVHAATMFPGVSEYILAGLEPLGTLPDFFAMEEAELDSYLSHLNYTLRSISRRNFFITKEMREDFGQKGVDGVFPVLLYFASLTGHKVIDASYVTLDANGEAVQVEPGKATGVWLRISRINPTYSDPPSQNVYYFKTDLSNSGFKGGSPFHKFLGARTESVAYLKAASYLMHMEDFSNIRNFLVGDCRYILQDASGIPAEFFQLYYDLTFYGNYAGPIDMFSEYDQPWLHKVYRSGVAKPLPFGTGYRMKDADSVQIFGVRKPG
jgi:hypothetical protein